MVLTRGRIYNGQARQGREGLTVLRRCITQRRESEKAKNRKSEKTFEDPRPESTRGAVASSPDHPTLFQDIRRFPVWPTSFSDDDPAASGRCRISASRDPSSVDACGLRRQRHRFGSDGPPQAGAPQRKRRQSRRSTRRAGRVVRIGVRLPFRLQRATGRYGAMAPTPERTGCLVSAATQHTMCVSRKTRIVARRRTFRTRRAPDGLGFLSRNRRCPDA